MDTNGAPNRNCNIIKKKELWIAALSLLLLESIYFLPVFSGWHSVPLHLFNSKFTGVNYHRDLPKDLIHMPGNDATAVLMDYPNEYYTICSIRSGRMPWWNPDIGMGRAWIGNAQVHPFSPLLIPMYIYPSTWTYTLQFVLGSLVCLIFAYIFFRILGLSLLPSVAGASLWTWNPFTLHSYIMSSIWAYWWMPLAMVGFAIAIRQKRQSGWIIASVALALMILCGQPETALILGEMAGIYLLILNLPFGAKWMPLKFLFIGVSIVIAMTLVLSAAQWYPILNVLGGSIWYKGHTGESISNLTHPFVSFFKPLSLVFLQPVCWGALVLLVATRKKREALAFCVMLIFTLSFSVPAIFNSFVFSFLRLNGVVPALHGAELTCVPLAAIFAIGLQTVLDTKREIPAYLKLTSLFVMVCLTCIGFLLSDSRIGWQVSIWIIFSVFCFGAVFTGIQTRKVVLSALVLLTVLYPLATQRFHYPYFSSCPQPDWSSNSANETASLPSARFWAQSSPFTGAPYLAPNLNLLSGIADIRSSSVLNPPGSYLFSRAWGPAGYISHLTYSFRAADPRLLGFLGVNRAVLARTGEESPFYIVAVKPGPRAFFVENIENYNDDKRAMERFKQLLSENLEYKVALIEDKYASPKSEKPGIEVKGGSSGKIEWLRNEPDSQGFSLECFSKGILVILDSYSPYLEASVDGKPVPVLKTDIMFRGVELTAGKHIVDLKYKTRGMLTSMWVSLVGWVFLVLWMVITLYREWKIKGRCPLAFPQGE